MVEEEEAVRAKAWKRAWRFEIDGCQIHLYHLTKDKPTKEVSVFFQKFLKMYGTELKRILKTQNLRLPDGLNIQISSKPRFFHKRGKRLVVFGDIGGFKDNSGFWAHEITIHWKDICKTVESLDYGIEEPSLHMNVFYGFLIHVFLHELLHPNFRSEKATKEKTDEIYKQLEKTIGQPPFIYPLVETIKHFKRPILYCEIGKEFVSVLKSTDDVTNVLEQIIDVLKRVESYRLPKSQAKLLKGCLEEMRSVIQSEKTMPAQERLKRLLELKSKLTKLEGAVKGLERS